MRRSDSYGAASDGDLKLSGLFGYESLKSGQPYALQVGIPAAFLPRWPASVPCKVRITPVNGRFGQAFSTSLFDPKRKSLRALV